MAKIKITRSLSGGPDLREKYFGVKDIDVSPGEAAAAAAERIVRDIMKSGRRKLKMTIHA